MSVTIQLRDFRGCASASLECSPIGLLAGLNRAGKSSVAQAVAAALTGDAASGTKELGMLVRTGAPSAAVEIVTESGTSSMSWPSGRGVTNGDPPEASAYAVGNASLVTIAQRDRARVLSEYLRAAPTEEDLVAALKPHGVHRDAVERAWEKLRALGWDGYVAERKDHGARLKGQWRQLTSVNYGSRVAASWRPDLDELDENDLLAAVARAKRDAEAAIGAAAVSQAERDRLAGEADLYPDRDAALQRADAEVEEAGKRLKAAQDARLALPPAERPLTLPCPHCEQPIVLQRTDLAGGVTLVKPGAILPDEAVKQRRLEIGSADGKVAHEQDALNLARRKQAEARTALQPSINARERLANWPTAVESGAGDPEAARQALNRAETRLAEFRAKREADSLHRQIENNEVLLGILAGDGLRAEKLRRVLGVFNSATLRELTAAAGWAEPVEIAEDMAISLGGRPYLLLSTSEQYRVRAVLAVAQARLDGSALVVLDAADVLDAPSRGGLFRMLTAANIPALVCMTLSRRDQVPPAAVAAGMAYWIEAGRVEPMQAEAKAA